MRIIIILLSIALVPIFSENSGTLEKNNNSYITPQKLFKVNWENDLFFNSDREYTNGIKMEYGEYRFIHSPTSWILSGFSYLSNNFSNKQKEYNGINLSQLMFTPSNLQRSDISRGERPYSAYNQLSLISSYLWNNSSLSIELGFGAIGPISNGKFFQSKIHEIVNSSLPEGWNNQIPNQKMLQLNSEYQYFFLKQFGIVSSVKYGGFDSSVGVGPIFRIGNIKTDVSQGTNLNSITPTYNFEEKENYFYIQPKINYQSWNGTLQASSHSLPSNIDPNEIPYALSTSNYNKLFSDPLYTSVSDQNSNSYYKRYILYQELINPKADFGINYLTYNAIFNGGEIPSDNLKNLIIYNIINTNTNNSNYAGLEYFVNQSLFRKDGEPISPLIRFMAYNYLLGPDSSIEKKELIASILYLNEFEGKKRYAVPLKNVQGKLNFGYVVQSETWYIQIWAELTTLEYNLNSNVPDFHRYAGVQFGYKFN